MNNYLSKIERNANAISKAPESVKMQCIHDIKWARELSSTLNNLDYDKREEAINNIIRVLDEDYQIMGFELPEKNKLI